MPIEIERKFLVSREAWRPLVSKRRTIKQGYLTRGNAPAVVRVRINDEGHSRLTIKSAATGPARGEFEYDIPMDHAAELLKLCGDHTLTKTRHCVPAGELTWEIDVFEGRHAGLVIAEVELSSPDQQLPLPPWLGKEVTDDPSYSNENLARPA